VELTRDHGFKNKQMGWNLTDSRASKFRATFENLEDAVKHLNYLGYEYYIEKPNLRKYDYKGYAENFLWKGPPTEDDLL
jgi:hypothetical protein